MRNFKNLFSSKSLGFSLIEVLVYVAIFGTVSAGIMGVVWNVTKVHTQQIASNEVDQNLSYAMTLVNQKVRDASMISSASGSTLVLTMTDSTKSPTTFSVSNGTLYMQEGTGQQVAVTSDKVNVDTLTFDKISMAGAKGGAKISITISYRSGGTKDLTFSKSLLSTVNRASAVTFDSDLLPASNNLYSVGASNPAWKNGYFSGTVNATGDITSSGYVKGTTGLCIGADCRTAWSSSGVTGSGTANYVSKWTSPSALGNSLIYDNGTNVGIGTTSGYKLGVVTSGTSVLSLVTVSSTVGNPQVDIYDTGRGVEMVMSSYDGTTAGTYIASYSNHPLMFGTNAGSSPTAKMTILSSGNVGIGITPAVKLDVNGAAHIGTLANAAANVLNIAGSSGNQVNIAASDNSSWGLLLGSDLTTAGVSGYHGPSNNYIINVNNAPLVLGTNNAPQMTILGNGNVGIGTASPGTKLQIYQPTKDTDALVIHTAVTSSDGAQHYGALSFQEYADKSANYSQIRSYSNLYSTWGSQLAFYVTTGGSPTLSEAMRINSSGNVGINTTSPGNKLDIVGGATRTGTHGSGLALYVTSSSAPASGGVEFRHDNGTQGIGFGYNTIYATGSSTNQHLILQARGTGYLTLNASDGGNVGIGTAAPGYKLDVSGIINSNNYVVSYGFYGNGNVGGTGSAAYFPNGLYSVGTNWIYGANTYITDGSAQNVLFRAASISGNSWSISTAGAITAPSFNYNSSYGIRGASGYFDTINTGGTGDPLEINYMVAGDMRMYNGDITQQYGYVIYPGSVSGLSSFQKSYYIASHANWGLYTNTSFDSAGGLYDAGSRVCSPSIGTCSVNITGSAGSAANADTVDSLHAASFSRKDTTSQWMKPYYEYGSYLTTEAPASLASQMGGGGLRIDFMYPSYTANGQWGQTITWSGYSYYGMYQLAGGYGSATPSLAFRHEVNAGTNTWSGWRTVCDNSDNCGYDTTPDNWSGSSISGDITLSSSNPYIYTGGSYLVIPYGAYFSGGTVYVANQLQARGGIHDDTHSALTIAGGTSNSTYFSGQVGFGQTPGWNGYWVVDWGAFYAVSDIWSNGNVYAQNKYFDIPHPTKPGYMLIHASIEGPETAVFYRGTGQLKDGKATVTLPEYFDALTRDGSSTVQLTPRGKKSFGLSYDNFNEKSFEVYGDQSDGKFDWLVMATRADQPPLQVEMTNAEFKAMQEKSNEKNIKTANELEAVSASQK